MADTRQSVLGELSVIARGMIDVADLHEPSVEDGVAIRIAVIYPVWSQVVAFKVSTVPPVREVKAEPFDDAFDHGPDSLPRQAVEHVPTFHREWLPSFQ